MSDNIFAFTTCDDILATLSRLMKKRRLEKGYTRKVLQSITGVPVENSLSRDPLRRSKLTPLYDLQLTPYYDVKLTPASNVN